MCLMICLNEEVNFGGPYMNCLIYSTKFLLLFFKLVGTSQFIEGTGPIKSLFVCLLETTCNGLCSFRTSSITCTNPIRGSKEYNKLRILHMMYCA